MSRTYTALRDLICTDGLGDGEVVFGIRYHFTVTPGCVQTLTQPAEDATVNIAKMMVCNTGFSWHTMPIIADLAHRVFGDDDAVHDWLMAEAMGQDEADRDDDADRRRDLRMEAAE